MKRQKSILLLQNNSSVVQPVTLFGTLPAQQGRINGVNYGWDISTLSVFELTGVSLQVGFGGSGFTTLTAPVTTDSLQAIADALNTLKAGFFYVFQSAGVTQIRTSNRFLRYGSLTVAQGLIWQATGLITAINPAIINVTCQIDDTTTAFFLLNILRAGTPTFSFPISSNFQVPPSQLANGDNIVFALITSPPQPYLYTGTIKQNGVIIRTINIGIPNLGVNFPYVAGATYDFQVNIN